MACEPRPTGDVYVDAVQYLRNLPHDVDPGVVFESAGCVAAYVLWRGIRGSEQMTRFLVERVLTDTSIRLIMTNFTPHWISDVVDLGDLKRFRNADVLIDVVGRTAYEFVNAGREHGGYTANPAVGGLRQGPWFLHVHRRTPTGWFELRIPLLTSVLPHGVTMDDVTAASRRAMQDYAHGL